MTNERFYVSKGKIRDKQKPNDWFTVKEVCALLNKQDSLLQETGYEILRLKEVLLKSRQLFNKLFNSVDAKIHFNLRYIIDLIDEVLK